MFTVKYWDARLYGDSETRDPVASFLKKFSDRVKQDSVVLDIGAGEGRLNRYDFRGQCKEMIGVDLDPRVEQNPLLDRGIRCVGDQLPLESNSVDLAFSIYVLEHVENAAAFCAEVARVLRPGGEFWALTPNRLHYVSLIADCTPTSFHKWINEKRGRDSEDTFPTFYRLNSPREVRKHFLAAGMEEVEITSREYRPNYLAFWLPLFLMGSVFERIVNSSPAFSRLRVNYVFGFRKAK